MSVENPIEDPLGAMRTISQLVEPDVLEKAGLATPLTIFMPENAENIAYYVGDRLETDRRVVVTERRSKRPEGLKQLWGATTIPEEIFIDDQERQRRFFNFANGTVVTNSDLGSLIELTITPPRSSLEPSSLG